MSQMYYSPDFKQPEDVMQLLIKGDWLAENYHLINHHQINDRLWLLLSVKDVKTGKLVGYEVAHITVKEINEGNRKLYGYIPESHEAICNRFDCPTNFAFQEDKHPTPERAKFQDWRDAILGRTPLNTVKQESQLTKGLTVIFDGKPTFLTSENGECLSILSHSGHCKVDENTLGKIKLILH